MVKRNVGLMALLLASVVYAGGDLTPEPVTPAFKSAPPVVLQHGVTMEEVLVQQRVLHEWLVSEEPAGARTNVTRVELNERDRQDLAVPYVPGSMTPMRVGVVKPVEARIGFSRGELIGQNNNTLQPRQNGGFVWATTIRSPGAVALRIHLEGFSIPQNAEVYIYTPEGEARGPYTGKGPDGSGEFWSHSVNSSTAIVQLQYAGAKDARALRGLSLRITDVAHIATDFPMRPAPEGTVSSFCTYNAPCVENNECGATSNPTGNGAEGAVAKMRWIAGAFVNICSGGLLADTAGSQTPYFLTANHCINKNKDAKNLETFFQYTASCGTTNCPAEFGQPFPPTTFGSSVLASGTEADYTLLQLNQTPGLAGTVFLGWNNSPVSGSSGAALHRVSHPSGAPQSYSNNFVDTGVGTCFQTARGPWIYSDNGTVGATEGGSSGSPVFNASGEVVGQLTGCCPAGGGNCNDVCDPDNSTIDGALAHYWSAVEQFLDPSGTVCGNGSCESGEDSCNCPADCAGTCCGNGTCETGEDENNCPEDCSSGCSLGGNGDPCTTNADCCSNKCRGGTCRGN